MYILLLYYLYMFIILLFLPLSFHVVQSCILLCIHTDLRAYRTCVYTCTGEVHMYIGLSGCVQPSWPCTPRLFPVYMEPLLPCTVRHSFLAVYATKPSLVCILRHTTVYTWVSLPCTPKLHYRVQRGFITVSNEASLPCPTKLHYQACVKLVIACLTKVKKQCSIL